MTHFSGASFPPRHRPEDRERVGAIGSQSFLFLKKELPTAPIATHGEELPRFTLKDFTRLADDSPLPKTKPKGYDARDLEDRLIMNRRTTHLLPTIALVTAGLTATALLSDTWPAFRGASGDGVSSEQGLPTEWSGTKNVLWTLDLPGRGNSSPAVTSDRVYLTVKGDQGHLRVVAVDAELGNVLWNVKLGDGSLKTFGPESLWKPRHNAATPSPTADENNVWAKFGTGDLVCLDRDGNLVWRRNLVKDFGQYTVRFGMATSPRVWHGLLIDACIHKGPDDSYIVAIDKLTGKDVWRTARPFSADHDAPDGYSSPVLLDTGTRVELVVAGSDHVDAYNPETGKRLWVSGGLKIDGEYGRIISSPAISREVIVACTAHPPNAGDARAIAVRPGGSGDVTESNRLWTYPKESPDCATPVCYGDYVYMVRDNTGVGSCVNLKTGQLQWKKRLHEGTFRSATVAGDGKVYFLNKEGVCVVVKAGPEGKVLAKNSLKGTFFATPAISKGVIYFRSFRRLYAVGSRR